MYKDLLPLGSVVGVKGNELSIMICGRVLTKAGEDKIYDYVGVPYPVGVENPDDMLFFDNDSIDDVEFIGCKNQIEKEFVDKILSPLDEASSIFVKNGKIVIE